MTRKLAKRSRSTLPLPVSVPTRVLADRVISKLRDAEKLLQSATTIHQAKLIADVAAAQEVFAHRQRLGDQVTAYAHEIRIYALAKLGELLVVMPKAVGTDRSGRRKKLDGSRAVPSNAPATLAELGINKKTAAIARQLALLPVPTRDAIAQQETTLREVLRDRRQEERVENLTNIALGNTPLSADVRYPVIYADPPWRYEHVKTDSRAIENQYPTESLDAICAMPVANLTTDDAVLFLWATSPKLAEAMRVIDAWGFTYRTCAVWDKDQIGMGYYFRQQHELLLVAVKGEPPLPAVDARPASVIHAPRGEHSAKPAVFYEVIERMYPTFPKIELFARTAREGWAAWGNQAA